MADLFAQLIALLQAMAEFVGAVALLLIALAIFSIRKPVGRWIEKDREGLKKLAPLLAKLLEKK